MRWVICAPTALTFVSPVFAADLGIPPVPQTVGPVGPLPVGPATFTRWSGFYFGGQIGYGDANADFSGATQPLVAFSLRDTALESSDFVSTWPVLGTGNSDAVGYGGFVGYNTQWQDLVLGLEGNYTHTDFATSASVSPLVGGAGRIVSAGGNQYSVNLTGTGQLEITDYASLRARGGWVLGNFLPYGFAGLVIGRGNYSVTTEVYGQQNSASPAFFPCAVRPDLRSLRLQQQCRAKWRVPVRLLRRGRARLGGHAKYFSTGRGQVDVQFAPIANIVASIVSARVGAGFKF